MRIRSLVLGLVSVPLVLAGLASSQEPRPKEVPSSRPVVGERAPSFRLNDHTGRAVELPLLEEKVWTVVAFFPKAATPG